jgi:hypothetical protein
MSERSHMLCLSHLCIFIPHLLVGALDTGQIDVYLTGRMLNSVSECADRARIDL